MSWTRNESRGQRCRVSAQTQRDAFFRALLRSHGVVSHSRPSRRLRRARTNTRWPRRYSMRKPAAKSSLRPCRSWWKVSCICTTRDRTRPTPTSQDPPEPTPHRTKNRVSFVSGKDRAALEEVKSTFRLVGDIFCMVCSASFANGRSCSHARPSLTDPRVSRHPTHPLARCRPRSTDLRLQGSHNVLNRVSRKAPVD